MSLYSMIGGFAGALAAAIPGLIDYSSLTIARIKRTATVHMTINLIAVALYAVNIWLRLHGSAPAGLPLVLSIVAVAGLGVSGWLGGHMVHVYGVGVASAPEPAGEVTSGERRAMSHATAAPEGGRR